jgi:hypothetical protein
MEDWGSLKPGYIGATQRATDAAIIKRNSGMRYNGDEVVAYWDWKGTTGTDATRKKYPYALVFKNPAYWETPPETWTEEDLVPNDSRMYQTKLVLWRLLQNRDLFKNFRFGLATTFLSLGNPETVWNHGTHYGINRPRQDMNGIFKVYPFGANTWTTSFFDADRNAYKNYPQTAVTAYLKPGSGKERVKYVNGTMHGPITGQIETQYAIHGQYYTIWHNMRYQSSYATRNRGSESNEGTYTYGKVDDYEPAGWGSGNNTAHYLSYGTKNRENLDRIMYKLFNRASLHVPIADSEFVWEKGAVSMDQVEKFRMWIDGIADLRSAGPNKPATDAFSYNNGSTSGLTGSFRDNQFHYYNQPEIGVAGVFALAQAIYPDPTTTFQQATAVAPMPLHLDRDYYIKNGWVWYSCKDANVNYRYDYRRASSELDCIGPPVARYNSGSGEAAGSVIDFFSPRKFEFKGSASGSYPPTLTREPAISKSAKGASAVNTINSPNDLADVSFPITNSCEDNWLIVVASGAEPKVEDQTKYYTYEAWEAVKNLYDSTNKENKGLAPNPNGPKGSFKAAYEPVTAIKYEYAKNKDGSLALDKSGNPIRTRKGFGSIDLDNPIRTIVIGIVASENDPNVGDNAAVKGEIKTMRKNLTRMAMAGRGYSAAEILAINEDNYMDAPVKPYFADNVESLRIAFEAALSVVTPPEPEEIASGALAQDRTAIDHDSAGLYPAYFRKSYNDQWIGELRRYVPVFDDKGAIISMNGVGSWELGKRLLAQRNTRGGLETERWNAAAKKFVEITKSDAESSDLFGLDGRLVVADTFGRPAFNEAMLEWFRGYDYSYLNARAYPRENILADFGQSAIALVQKPVSSDTLPGYKDWAAEEEAKRNDSVIYAQTNDGVLRLVNPQTGNQIRAILPPPALLPTRLASLKTKPGAEDNLIWMDVVDEHGGIRSNSAFTLDGSLQLRRFDSGGWKSFLLGTLGRGGDGLYMLDVSNHDDPKFLWYKEHALGRVVSMGAEDDFPAWSGAAGAGDDEPFLKLGNNSPKPAMGVTKRENAEPLNFIALPGGAQDKIDLANNGTVGAALLFLDPADGSVIRAFDGASLGAGWRVGTGERGDRPYMGMMVSEPTLQIPRGNLPYERYLTGRVYTADNRGNIFVTRLADDDGSAMPPRRWDIRTAATLQPNAANGRAENYAIPHGVALMSDDRTTYIAGGTSDVSLKESAEGIGNASQMLFSFEFADGETGTISRGDIEELDAAAGARSQPDKKGWYIPLEKSVGYGDEYVSAKPVVVGGTMYAATFMYTKINIEDAEDLCNASHMNMNGRARIYAADVKNGSPGRWKKDGAPVKYLEIDGVKIEGITTVTNEKGVSSLLMSLRKFSPLSEETKKALDENGINVLSGLDALSFIAQQGGPGITNIPPGDSILLYWTTK